MSRLIPGTPVVWQGRNWVLLDIPAIDKVLVRDPESGQTELASPNELEAPSLGGAGRHGLMAIPDAEWNEAWSRFQAIRPLLDRGIRKRTRKEVDEVAKSFGKDPATVYRWISKWEESKTVSGLIKRGRSDSGKSRC